MSLIQQVMFYWCLLFISRVKCINHQYTVLLFNTPSASCLRLDIERETAEMLAIRLLLIYFVWELQMTGCLSYTWLVQRKLFRQRLSKAFTHFMPTSATDFKTGITSDVRKQLSNTPLQRNFNMSRPLHHWVFPLCSVPAIL